jgi:hypothetical protein
MQDANQDLRYERLCATALLRLRLLELCVKLSSAARNAFESFPSLY